MTVSMNNKRTIFSRSRKRGRRMTWGSQRAGATAVELALILPFYCMLVGGAVEIGRFLWVKTVIEEAALAGCRAATIHNANMDEVRTAVESTMAPLSLAEYTVNVEPSDLSNVDHLEPITVRVNAEYSRLSFFFDLTNGNGVSGGCVLAAERYDD